MTSPDQPADPPGAADPVADPALIRAALAVRRRAYAPYSRFLVGAAIRDTAGGVHLGCNVENAAYPEGSCAEAGAVAAMIAAGGRRIAAVAIAGTGDIPCAPCGGCRQKLAEFADGDIPVAMTGENGDPVAVRRLDQLLPGSFRLSG